MKGTKNTAICVLTAVMLMLMLIPSPTQAIGLIDMERDIDFTVEYICGETKVAGAEFDIYKVADTDAYEQMTLRPEFASYPIDFKNIDQDGWRDYAATAKGYVQLDGLEPLAVGETGTDGKAEFVMQAGLYLVIGKPAVNEAGETYTSDPFMIFLPQYVSETDDWSYSVTAIPKNTVNVTGRKVLKIWNDDGHTAERPESVTVRLLRDGEEFDVQELSAANNWRYEWDGLEGGHEWNIVEDEVPGYSTIVQQQGITFTITNAYKPVPSPQPTRTPEPHGPLPQTGLLWWPVPVLLVVGMIVFLLGVSRRRA